MQPGIKWHTGGVCLLLRCLLSALDSTAFDSEISKCAQMHATIYRLLSDCNDSQCLCEAVLECPTELSKVEASTGGRGEAGARGERGITGRVLQPAGGVGAQPITVLVTSQLWWRTIPAESERNGFNWRPGHTKRDDMGSYYFINNKGAGFGFCA